MLYEYQMDGFVNIKSMMDFLMSYPFEMNNEAEVELVVVRG